MGYRSEACLVLDGESKIILQKLCEVSEIVKSLVDRVDDSAGWDDISADNDCKLSWSHIKWNCYNIDIRHIEDFIECLPGESFHFLRIGEDNEDIEERGFYTDSGIYIHRSIQGW